METAASHLDAAIRALRDRAPDRAVESLLAYLEHDPGEVAVWGLLGETLLGLGRAGEAEVALARALALDGEDDRARFQRVRALDAMGRSGEALAEQARLVARHPENPDFLRDLALLRRREGDHQGAEADLRRALSLDPDHGETRLALAHTLLALEAWPEAFSLYESRLTLPGWARAPLPGQPWDGSPLEGRSLLVSAEQGLGDGLQFLRYLQDIDGASRLVVECHPPLRRILEDLPHVDRVVPFSPDGDLPEVDLHVPMGSLPALVGGSSPRGEAVPYLWADPLPEIRRRGPGERLLGLVWRSSGWGDSDRDPPLEAFAPLGDLPGIRWVSLQWPEAPPPFALEMGSISGVTDFLDTARLVAALDGVVAVDTAVPHVAAAMGKPVWMALGSRPDWRWTARGETTPWYPTMRLFRRGHGSWTDVLDRLSRALAESV